METWLALSSQKKPFFSPPPSSPLTSAKGRSVEGDNLVVFDEKATLLPPLSQTSKCKVKPREPFFALATQHLTPPAKSTAAATTVTEQPRYVILGAPSSSQEKKTRSPSIPCFCFSSTQRVYFKQELRQVQRTTKHRQSIRSCAENNPIHRTLRLSI